MYICIDHPNSGTIKELAGRSSCAYADAYVAVLTMKTGEKWSTRQVWYSARAYALMLMSPVFSLAYACACAYVPVRTNLYL